MKYTREIKVGVLAIICVFLLFYGLNFLKGVNIFSPTNSYHGVYTNLHGLEVQASVFIMGHKVGQVDRLRYDFTKDSAFTVDISIRKDIVLPEGTSLALRADGLLGGMALELLFPEDATEKLQQQALIKHGATLPTVYLPGLMENLQNELIAKIANAVEQVDTLVAQLNGQLEGDHLKSTLANVDRISGDLTDVSGDLRRIMNTQVPGIVNNADTAIANLNTVIADIKAADLKATVARVDTAIEGVNAVVADVRAQKGTLGQLIYNKSLYNHVDATVISADSLLTDIKAHPKRYVHFSVFGKKDK
jgi:phospholipid/cholesterol/gamma-HCH transport system substrate-binding protein